MEKFEFTTQEDDKNKRIDKFLCEKFFAIKPEITRSKIQKLIEDGNVSAFDLQGTSSGEKIFNASYKIKSPQKFLVIVENSRPLNLEAKKIDFEIIFEDDDLLVINKPAGLTVHPGAGNNNDTLVNALLFTHSGKLSSINGEFRPGIVHRLDKDTTGLMLVAKNDFTHQILSKNLQERKISRSYKALIYGALTPKQGMINKNIARSRINRLKMSVVKNGGRNAITNYQTKEVFCDGFVSLVECKLETGRTHQIRVHMESIKHSLVGDKIYNGSKKTAPKNIDATIKDAIAQFPRQALHSYKIEFMHPRSGKKKSFAIDLPKDLQNIIELMRFATTAI